MRRPALSASFLLVSGMMLSGCSGATVFFTDTHWFAWNPNRPIGDSENIRRVKGVDTAVEPLKPEEGNVWPGPAAPEPTLQDLERQQNQLGEPAAPPATGPFLPDHQQPRPIPRESGSPLPGTAQPGTAQPGTPPPGLPSAVTGPPPVPPPSTLPGAGPQGRIYQTPRGPAVSTGSQGAIGTGTGSPTGTSGNIVVPNGNGTSTVIAPDGSITTVPTPK